MVWLQKESVELTSVYPNEGCGKTQSEINDTIPHTVVDMGHQGTECTYPHDSTRNECCFVPSFRLENYHIFIRGLAKNTFTIFNARRHMPNDSPNVGRIFRINNTHWGIVQTYMAIKAVI